MTKREARVLIWRETMRYVARGGKVTICPPAYCAPTQAAKDVRRMRRRIARGERPELFTL